MNALISTLGSTPETLILREALNIFSNVTFKGNLFSIISTLSSSLGKLFFLFLLRSYIENSKPVAEAIKNSMRSVVYRVVKYNMSSYQVPFFSTIAIKKTIVSGSVINGFPIYFESKDEYFYLSVIPFVHNGFLQAVHKEAERLYAKHTAENILTTKCMTLSDTFRVKKMFPSHNYTRLGTTLTRHFLANKAENNFSTLRILLDGEQGLGKSDCLHYLAMLEVCDEVIKVDFTNNLKKPFADISNAIHQKKGKKKSSIIMLDELDKYIEFNLKERHAQLKKEKDAKVPSFKDFYNLEKERFLFELLNLIEMEFDGPTVMIFCSNNFDTLFSGIKSPHFQSLASRFTRITFNRCGTEELKDFLRYINNTYLENGNLGDMAISKDDLEILLSSLNDDINIPYRDIYHLKVRSGYNFSTFIEMTNQWTDVISRTPSSVSEDEEDEDEEEEEEVVDETQKKS
jgi:hypothetical protein